MKTAVKFCLGFVLIVACQSSHKNYSVSPDMMEAGDISLAEEKTISAESESIPEAPEQVIKCPDKIIKEADIKFEVENYKKAKKEIDSLVNGWGAYISSEDENYSSYQVTNTIVIRVLNRNFEKLLDAIGNTSKKIDYKSINSVDVTEEYVDIESRLKTKKEVEQRYHEILKRANTIEDILKVENEIRVIREEIEAAEGRLKYLDDRVSFSTITLTIYQQLEFKYKPDKETRFFTRLYRGLDKGWKGLLAFIVALVHIWPLIIAGIIVWILLVYFKKKKQSKKTAEK